MADPFERWRGLMVLARLLNFGHHLFPPYIEVDVRSATTGCAKQQPIITKLQEVHQPVFILSTKRDKTSICCTSGDGQEVPFGTVGLLDLLSSLDLERLPFLRYLVAVS